jgi:iron complex transport system substrate-binding protein
MTISARTRTAMWAAAAALAAFGAWGVLRARARQTIVADTPQGRPRVVALVSGVVDTLDAMGALDCVVAMGSLAAALPGTERIPRILADERGGMTNPEGILALRPDHVFVAKELVPPLEGRGLDLVTVPQDSFEELPEFVLRLGRLVGREDAARAALARMDAKTAEIRRRVAGLPRVRVYWEDGAPGRTRGPGTAVHAMIELAGGENVYRDDRIARPTISLETILAADPEVIVVNARSGSPEEVKSRPGWDRISAVRNGRVFALPESERAVTLFTPRCVESCERTFLRWFHPELEGTGER